ncbi:biliverdin-producing heme oxygenase [Pseudomonas sp.]|uniref:biliverdin-producing heme oxygenase n=1 Tax=Pseudomonas sp. TaxID=306 RepID=UPI0028AAE344|nr:biliverdin-producing heme oxygenase [Pseudomonas sp.]
MNSVRTRLRCATAPQHQQVDQAFSRFRLEQPAGYRAFLRAHAQAIGPLEMRLQAAGVEQLLPDWPQRRRWPALQADLADLGEPLVISMPAAADKPPSAAWCWGALYVIEGSRLGGRLLARRVASGQPDAPLRYLDAEAAPSWPAFIERLDQQAATLAWAPLLAGAQAAFSQFLDAARLPT